MRRFFLSVLSILTCIFLYQGAVSHVHAEENFETKLHTTYHVNDQGIARVTHEFTTINKTPLFFIKQYGLKVSSNSLSEISVLSNGTKIEPEVSTTKTETSIGITFPDRAVGENKQRTFVISYTNPDATVVSGNVLEVYVPKLTNTDTYSEYTLTIDTPLKFAAPSRVHPGNYTLKVEGTRIYTTLSDIGQESVVAVYGQEQYFDLKLRYSLENPSNGVRLMQIALPPDTQYQRMMYHSLEPRPDKIERDKDGNWIGTYTLPANVTQVVETRATAKVSLSPDTSIPVSQPTSDMLQANDFWPTSNSAVQGVAGQYGSVKDLYGYVVNTLEYDYTRLQENPVERLGAAGALSEPSRAMCQEYTDLFISLSRAKGIPARRATGYAYTENETLRPLSFVQDILHAWPEYFDAEKQQWQPIDPTWEDTSGGINYFDQFDLNHVVFAYNGSSSTLPLPAGSYKTQADTKDVEVSFAPAFIAPTPVFTIDLEQPKISFLPLSSQAEIQLTNQTGQAYYGLPLVVESPQVLDWQPPVSAVESILPFQTVTIPVTLVSTSWWKPETVTLTVTYADHTTNLTAIAAPRLVGELARPYVLLGVGIGATVLTLGTWSVLVLRKKR